MNHSIGEKIRSLREEKRKSQEELGNALGISRQRMGRIENGEADTSYEMICKIANILEVSPKTITDAAIEEKSLGRLFRSSGESKFNEECEKLFNIIDVLYAHKNIYMRTTRR